MAIKTRQIFSIFVLDDFHALSSAGVLFFFSKLLFYSNFFQGHYHSVKRFVSRSGQAERADLFLTVCKNINRQLKSPLLRNE